jgi:signal transduction histidine kinase
MTDITVRKQVEEERKKLHGQLLQAQKMESIGVLAGGVAHDFNNLLHTMRGSIELLIKNNTLGPSEADRLQTVIKSLDRAGTLVQQLLLFSRKVESSRVRVDLGREVRDVAAILERTIPKMISVEWQLAPLVRPISGDPVQIEQVLLNLANNSVDVMPQGGRLQFETANVELDQEFVKRHPGSKKGEYVLLTVTDTGHGMDEATRKQIFDPFFTTKEVGKGTGLGLASVYGIVKAHGGYIHCSSQLGQGTTFRVYLPVAEEGGFEPVASQNTQSMSKTGPDHDRTGNTILVVDDEAEIRELTREALEGLGTAFSPRRTGRTGSGNTMKMDNALT